MKNKPSFDEERAFWKRNIELVIGLDEVGRGAFAGPIVAAGVIFKPNFKHAFLENINDSKLLKPKLREELSGFIKSNS
ncbi:MAG: ribonuclease HII, partial [Candidatus Levybacteria bacterium]|nr:ribonuclease HII [Candidatus Levybacteria bacterium]